MKGFVDRCPGDGCWVLGPGSTIPAQVPGTSMKTFLYGSRLKCSPTKMKIGAKHFSVLLCWCLWVLRFSKENRLWWIRSLSGVCSHLGPAHTDLVPAQLACHNNIVYHTKKIIGLTCDSFALLLNNHLAHGLVLLHLVLLVPRISLTSIQWWFWIFSKDCVDQCQKWGTLIIMST